MELCTKDSTIPLGICDVRVGVEADAALEGTPAVVVLHLQAMEHGFPDKPYLGFSDRV